jgi:uncharacterized protein YajQ (UPF0234 family)
VGITDKNQKPLTLSEFVKVLPIAAGLFYICHLPKLINMPSFDIVSKVDAQALDNAVNVVTKEITNRFDFKGSHVVINLDKKEFQLKLETDDDMKMRQLIDVLINRAHKQGIAPEAFDAAKEGFQSGKVWKKEIKVKNGLAQEDAKKIVKAIKDSGMKVQASINDDLVRVVGKKIDDLQAVIQLCKNANLGIPLQFVNMRD